MDRRVTVKLSLVAIAGKVIILELKQTILALSSGIATLIIALAAACLKGLHQRREKDFQQKNHAY